VVIADRTSLNSEAVLRLPGVRARSILHHRIEMRGPTVCETRWAQ
jgi:hypothetical protein